MAGVGATAGQEQVAGLDGTEPGAEDGLGTATEDGLGPGTRDRLDPGAEVGFGPELDAGVVGMIMVAVPVEVMHVVVVDMLSHVEKYVVVPVIPTEVEQGTNVVIVEVIVVTVSHTLVLRVEVWLPATVVVCEPGVLVGLVVDVTLYGWLGAVPVGWG